VEHLVLAGSGALVCHDVVLSRVEPLGAGLEPPDTDESPSFRQQRVVDHVGILPFPAAGIHTCR
jgi:hypothetical protein